MIGSFRNFAKTKFAGLLVFLMIIPFVFWGMGSMFSTGNTNTIAQINKTKISTQEFIDYLNSSNIPQETIRQNLDKNIIEELLSGLISRTLIELEVMDYNVIFSEKTLLKKIKNNKNFHDENGNFQRLKYEKFLLENNQSAAAFELRLRGRELQKKLFDYMGAGTYSPKFLVNKLFEDENRKVEIDYINLNNFYKKSDEFSNQDLQKFINDNEDQLKIEYLDFDYVIINPKNLIGINEYNQLFFDKIDQIEADISNEVQFETVVSNLDLIPIKKNNFRFSEKKTEIEKKIFSLRNNNYDIFENNDDFILFKVNNIDQRKPDLNDNEIKKEIIELIFQKNKFQYNKELLERINSNNFSNNDFIEMGKNKLMSAKINSIRDNKKFEIDAVRVLYSLPINSFTLINDDKNNIYLAKIKKFQKETIKDDNERYNEYLNKQNSKMKQDMLKTYDLFLSEKYDVVLNQKTIERVKNFFQ